MKNCVLCSTDRDGTKIKGKHVCTECMGNYASVAEVEEAIKDK